MAHFLCHLGCSHFGALLLDFYFTENRALLHTQISCSESAKRKGGDIVSMLLPFGAE